MKTNKFYYWLLTISAVVLLFNSTQLSAQTCTPPPAGMVAWFPGDGNANDIQGGNNGTPNGGVTFTAGKVAQAFNFDGTGDVTYPTINAGSTYTLDFWMRPTLTGVNQHVISNIANSTNYGSLRFVNNHVEYLQSGAFQVISPAGSVPLNTYTHIALTYDGSVTRLYINGSLAATSGVHTETFNNQLSLGFTIFNNYGESRFNGQIDEVEIFNRALLQAEIQAIVTADSAGKCKPPITFIVNTTSDTDDGACNTTHCSLREAIIAANANSVTSSPDRIEFNIPGSGPHTIMPTSALPTIADPVVIDGYTQPGAMPNTNATGAINAVLKIELNGVNAGAGVNGLQIVVPGDSTVRGLVVNRFREDGIYIQDFGSDNFIQGNFIGTDVSGTTNLGNNGRGIGMADLAFNNTIGGITPDARNIIAFNGQEGVAVTQGSSNSPILSNSIFSNTQLGIDLFPNGVTLNDTGDADTGSNNLQNYPVLTTAMSGASGATVQGTFNSMPNMTFRVEFFSNPACDPSGFGEGQSFIGAQSVTTDASGNATVSFTSSGAVAAGQFITSTATDPNGNTSEFSACRVVLGPTAATVSVGGRITTSSGFGISQARVSITDAKGETRTVLTNQSGYYRFDEAEAGQTYIVSASRKRYQFVPSTQVISVSEDLVDVDFMALPYQRMKP